MNKLFKRIMGNSNDKSMYIVYVDSILVVERALSDILLTISSWRTWAGLGFLEQSPSRTAQET